MIDDYANDAIAAPIAEPPDFDRLVALAKRYRRQRRSRAALTVAASGAAIAAIAAFAWLPSTDRGLHVITTTPTTTPTPTTLAPPCDPAPVDTLGISGTAISAVDQARLSFVPVVSSLRAPNVMRVSSGGFSALYSTGSPGPFVIRERVVTTSLADLLKRTPVTSAIGSGRTGVVDTAGACQANDSIAWIDGTVEIDVIARRGDLSTQQLTQIASSIPPIQRVQLVTPSAVGRLHFGVATEADVRHEVGAPEATVHGSFGVSTYAEYRALGYRCSNTKGTTGIRIGPYGVDAPPYCRTVYYINIATSTLAGFETTTTDYATAKGTKVGMSAAQAARREGHAVGTGCFTGIKVGAQSWPLQMFIFVGTRPGDRVSAIVADNRRNTVGNLFC